MPGFEVCSTEMVDGEWYVGIELAPGRPARLLDVVQGRPGAVLSGWLAARDANFRARIVTASLTRSAVTPPHYPGSWRRAAILQGQNQP